ncbi:Tim44 domain-containing protein [Pseudovibrio sp. SPO723]|uniref:Tim44 domain-containing protein n=1 Tax=Nesiotobacter zosterae TaxID=392721 RepID=UPI0029C4EBAF|nr:Tim44 domain-containing protein [Pseudovibrio sp. SPO723]MDX5595357.1 Tim44 domain-containing protein [Pseudovibrio sp. SPO723]
MRFFTKSRRVLSLLILSVAVIFVTAEFAEAKRGFSFGSRGSRTYTAPKTTNTAPQTQPLQRSMTPNNQATQPAGAAQQTRTQQAGAATQQRRGMFGGGFMGTMLGGLMLGGLIGMLMGHGLGGFAGFMGLLFQLLLIGGAVWLLMRFLRSRQQPQAAGAGHGYAPHPSQNFEFNDAGGARAGSSVPNAGARPIHEEQAAPAAESATPADDEVGLTADDFDRFEEMLTTVWTAYGNEDYGAIRQLTTPEIMGYFAEELGQAASNGLINEVRDIKLLQGDLSEAWREGDQDFATVAMRYESIDVTRERATNKVVEGNPEVPEERTEIWTFVRQAGEPWKLSAIQQP